MTVIAEYTLPEGDFAVGLAAAVGVDAELERLVVEDGGTVGYFWVCGDTDVPTERRPETGGPASVTLVDEVGDRRLYRVVLHPDEESFVGAFARFDAEVLNARGDDDRWWFRIGFPDRDVLSDFQSYCVDTAAVDLDLDRLYNPIESAPRVDSDLTPRQRETLITAHGKGYYDIPRKITLVGLAEELDVSDQAVSERLRRGESKLIRSHLLDD
jgi:predicted DNA binding protein